MTLEGDVWDVVSLNIPFDAIQKSLPGWIVICRHHAEEILAMPEKHFAGKDLWPAFSDCWAPEEAFFPTALSLLGLLPETMQKSLTYAEWNHRAQNQQSRAHPRTWDNVFDGNLVATIRKNHGCLVLRKLKEKVRLREWKEAMQKASIELGKKRNLPQETAKKKSKK